MGKRQYIVIFETDDNDKYSKNWERIVEQLTGTDEKLLMKPLYDEKSKNFIVLTDENGSTYEILKTLSDMDSGFSLQPLSIDCLSEIKKYLRKSCDFCNRLFNATDLSFNGGSHSRHGNNAKNDNDVLNGPKTASKSPCDNIDNTIKESSAENMPQKNIELQKNIINKPYDDNYTYINNLNDLKNGFPSSYTLFYLRMQTGYDELLGIFLDDRIFAEPIADFENHYPEMKEFGTFDCWCNKYLEDAFLIMSDANSKQFLLSFDSFIRAVLNKDASFY